jgi:hypothetical protein
VDAHAAGRGGREGAARLGLFFARNWLVPNRINRVKPTSGADSPDRTRIAKVGAKAARYQGGLFH